jgi:RNA polymerase sigma-70 factor (ECF subfamily)
MINLSDEELVAILAQRNATALAILYDRHGAAVYGLCLAILRDHHMAEDTTQEVFAKLWRQPRLYDPKRGRFATWILSVARHRAIDEWRHRRQDLLDPGGDDAILSLPHDSLDVEGAAVVDEERRAVRRALADLPPAQRQVIELAYLRGMTQSEIAAYLNEPLGTIKTRARLAMQKIRASLIAQGWGR